MASTRPSVPAAAVKAAAPAPGSVLSPAAPPADAAALASSETSAATPESVKDAFLGRLRAEKKFFYSTVIAQAQRIESRNDAIVFTFAPAHRTLRTQLEQSREWLETIAQHVAGRRVIVTAVEGAPPAAPSTTDDRPAAPRGQDELRAKAMQNEGVQALLDVFGAEIKEIEEM
jgi:hypothetical protein